MDGVMRISEGYFLRLLHHTPASEALVSLSGSWEPRLIHAAPWLGLSEVEHDVHMVLLYLRTVASGGHAELLHLHEKGSPPSLLVRLASALLSLELRGLSSALAEACCLSPASVDERTASAIDQEMVARAAGGAATLSALDERVWRDPTVEPALLWRLRDRHAELLLPERGLPPLP